MRYNLFQTRRSLIYVLPLLLTFSSFAFSQQIIFSQDWESGIGNWWVDNGVWEVGVPTSGIGPGAAYQGSQCAGTVLAGNYPEGANSRLISPYINLPSISNPGDEIFLRYYNWFQLNTSFFGAYREIIQLSVGAGNWQTVYDGFTGNSSGWYQEMINLSAFADSTVRIAFYISPGFWTGADLPGIYIDNVTIEIGAFPYFNPENWENGIRDWWVDQGDWQVGHPDSTGPCGAYTGQNCAATALSGNYPSQTTRLISPPVTLTALPGQYPGMFFWHWFQNSGLGRVQISVNYGSWLDLTNNYSGTSSVWTQVYVDLFNFADSTVRFAFYKEGAFGWFIDDIRIEGIENSVSGFSPEFSPQNYALDRPYPNPFNPQTTLSFTLPVKSDISLKVFDLQGRTVTVLAEGEYSPGSHQLKFDASHLPSGVYFARLQAGEFNQTQKLLLVK